MWYIMMITLIVLLTGCSTGHRHGSAQIKERIQAQCRPSSVQKPNKNSVEVNDLGKLTLSRETAIGMALRHNASLQASFERLGIAQADLAIAGLYTNPYIDGIFGIPHQGDDPSIKTLTTIYVGFRLADLWLVPAKKKVADVDCTIASWEATINMLDTIREVTIAYDGCIHAYTQSDMLKGCEAKVANCIDLLPTELRASLGVSRTLHRIQQERIKRGLQVKLAELHLQQLINGSGLSAVLFTDKLQDYLPLSVPSLDQLELTLSNNPSIVLANERVEQCNAQLSYERRRLFEDTTVGYNYETNSTNFGNPKLNGPFFHTSIPLFHGTHANTERVRANISQRSLEAQAVRALLIERIAQARERLVAVNEQLKFYNQEMLPLYEQELARAEKALSQNVESTVIMQCLEAIMAWYDTQQGYMDMLLQIAEYSAQLDHLLARRWRSITESR